MRQRLEDELFKSSKITTFKQALDHVKETKETGSHSDVDSFIKPTMESFMTMCTPDYKSLRKFRLSWTN